MSEAPHQGNNVDFDALYRGHARDVYRYSLSLVCNPVDAEDVTQTTFLNAFQAFSDHPPKKPRPWLIAIARNICHDRYRQSLRRPRQVTLHDVTATPAEDHSAHAAEILSALKGIPSRQRMALLLDGLEGRSRAEIAKELGIGEATVSGLLTRGRNNLRLQLDEGMTCERAQWTHARRWADGLPRTERRAAVAHLRNCEQCGTVAKPAGSFSGLLGMLWLGWRNPTGTGRLAEAAAGAGGGAFAAKIALLATVGTLAGGVAWHESGRFHAGQPPASLSPAVVSHPLEIAGARPPASRPWTQAEPAALPSETTAPSRPGSPATGRLPVARERPVAALAPPPAATLDAHHPSAGPGQRSLAGTPGSETQPAPADTHSISSESTTPASNGEGGQAQANGDQEQSNGGQSDGGLGNGGLVSGGLGNSGPGGGRATAPGQLKKLQGASGGQTTAPGLQKKADTPAGKAGAPGQQKKAGASTSGETNAPGQEKKTDADTAADHATASGQAAAPGQEGNPGQGNSGGGQATAPGQQGNPGQGNSGGGQATAPGQQGNPGQGNSGGGQATAPGQQGNPGQGNSGGGQATAPGQQGNPGQGNSGGGQATAPGQQGTPGQDNSPGPGNAGSQPQPTIPILDRGP